VGVGRMSAFAVAIGCKADMGLCAAHVLCVLKTSHGDFRVKGQKESLVHE
jgi:hypothetical protein